MVKRWFVVILTLTLVLAAFPFGANAQGDCVPPAGWVPYTVVAGDTIESVAAANGIGADELTAGNCLVDQTLTPGQTLYVPAAQPQQPAPNVTITEPVEGATLPIGTPFRVAGNGASPSGNVTVRVMDVNGRILAEGTTAFNGIVPGSGGFIIDLSVALDVPQGTAAEIAAFVLDSSGFEAARDTVNVVFGQAPQQNPTVIIVNPQRDQVVPIGNPFYVSGTSANLTDRNLTIRALDNFGNVLTQATAVAAGPGEVHAEGAGGWSTNLTVNNVAPGTRGAISVASAGVTLAITNVIYGQAQPAAFIDITNPPPNVTLYTDRPIRVSGVAGGLFENALVVRALDNNGRILAQQPVTTNATQVGGIGGWQVDLFVTVPAGTRGSIYAFATSARDGSVVAEDIVNVIYGGPCIVRTDWPTYTVQRGETLFGIAQRVGSSVAELTQANCLANANVLFAGQVLRVPRLPATPAPNLPQILITSPLPQAVLDIATAPVIVTGTATGLQQGNLVVRALDLNGTVLAQQAAPVSAPNIGGTGNWQAQLAVSVAPGTQGYIYAYSTNLDGSIIADAIVNVTFGVPTAATEASLIIDAPQPDAAIVTPVTVSGRGTGLFGGAVFVRLLDQQGNVVAEELAAASVPDAAGAIRWEATLDSSIPLGTHLIVYAYALSSIDATVIASAAVNVVVGQTSDAPFVTIIDPMPYTTLGLEEPFTASGRAGRLPGGQVIVRALDAEGNILDEQPVPVSGVNAAGEGTWEASFDLNIAPGTRGSLMVFAVDENSSVVASALIRVIFGDVSENNRFVIIDTPLPDTLVDLTAGLTVAGRGGGLFEGNVVVQVLDEEGNVLASQPTTVNAPEVGAAGAWQTAFNVADVPDGAALTIYAFSESPSDGSVIARDRITVVQRAGAGFGLGAGAAGAGAGEGVPLPEGTEEFEAQG